MATVDLGAIRFNWKGAYSGGTAYVVDDVVSSGGASYICIQAHGAGTQAVSVAAYWDVMSTAGTNGTDVGTTITTQGDILFRDGSGLQRLAKGTAAQALKINAGATAPEWVTNSFVDADINASAAIALTKLATNPSSIGKSTIWMPAIAMLTPTTNGAPSETVETTATRPDLKVLDFDAGTQEYAQFSIAFPKSWNLGTVTFQPYWCPASTNTGNCIWGLQGVGVGDGDTADVVYGTGQTSTDAGIGTVEDVQVGPESSAITIAGTPADNDITFFQVYRLAADGGDTFSADARLLGVKVFFTTDAENDA